MPIDGNEALVAAFATNNRINEFLIRNLPDEAWRATPTPLDRAGGKGRDCASMLAHMHNVRLMWLKSFGKTAVLPEKLEGDSFTKDDAVRAFGESWKAVESVVREALAGDGRVKGFKPDVYSFLAYLFAHEGHHRGQISMLARQVGHPLRKRAMFGMWEWGTR
jgi:uncharacterized damage-inducible protein DinB